MKMAIKAEDRIKMLKRAHERAKIIVMWKQGMEIEDIERELGYKKSYLAIRRIIQDWVRRHPEDGPVQ